MFMNFVGRHFVGFLCEGSVGNTLKEKENADTILKNSITSTDEVSVRRF